MQRIYLFWIEAHSCAKYIPSNVENANVYSYTIICYLLFARDNIHMQMYTKYMLIFSRILKLKHTYTQLSSGL